jgi:hypothetical protein
MRRALILVALLAAACGGGSATSANPRAAYLGKAEAVCAKANDALAAAKKTQPASIAAVPPYVHKLVDIAKTNVDELGALTPPPKDKADLDAKVLSPLRAQVTDGTAYAAQVDAAAAKKDSAALTQLVFNPPTKTRADVAWMKTYGFSACVKAADTGAAGK